MSAPAYGTARTVTDVTLPPCSYGYRSGYARALVNGERRILMTSRSASTDPAEHLREVAAAFAAGKGHSPVMGEAR